MRFNCLGSEDENNLSSDESDYATEPAIHFLDAGGDDDDDDDDDLTDYQYLKRHGHSRNRLKYAGQLKGRKPKRTSDSDSDDDIDGYSDPATDSDDD